ncbi:MAG TPA: ThiF family adenylyltransferase [Rhodanobacteraceae bacterium]|nr:ThiF family adenylyltransferase [Rhodanobacteraceae bacterium]
MSGVKKIGDRHLRPADGLSHMLQPDAQSVRIVVADEWGSSRSGQLLVTCLVNLLCRQVGLVRHLEVVARSTAAVVRLPNGQAVETFPNCLEALVSWAVGDAVSICTSATVHDPDHLILIGNTSPSIALSAERQVITVIADGWCAWVGEPDKAPRNASPNSRNPLGPFFGATLAAGEVFKRTRGITRGRFLSAAGYSLWSGESNEDWCALEDGPEVSGLSLCPIHIFGLGAVGNGLAYLMQNMELDQGYFILVDDDVYDGTNLNRCFLAGAQDVSHKKVDAISSALLACGIETFPYDGTVKTYVSDIRRGLRSDVARQVDNSEFEIVASCVDKGISRQDIQGLQPRLLMGGSTLDMTARTNWYSQRPGAACLACFNPKERDGENIRELERQLRQMLPGARRDFLVEQGLNVEAVEEYLANPQCGSIGEATLNNFATRPPTQFSAGFVSLGAALLLGARLLQQTVLKNQCQLLNEITTLNFLNGGRVNTNLAADDQCEWGCQERRSHSRVRS